MSLSLICALDVQALIMDYFCWSQDQERRGKFYIVCILFFNITIIIIITFNISNGPRYSNASFASSLAKLMNKKDQMDKEIATPITGKIPCELFVEVFTEKKSNVMQSKNGGVRAIIARPLLHGPPCLPVIKMP